MVKKIALSFVALTSLLNDFHKFASGAPYLIGNDFEQGLANLKAVAEKS